MRKDKLGQRVNYKKFLEDPYTGYEIYYRFLLLRVTHFKTRYGSDLRFRTVLWSVAISFSVYPRKM